MRALAAPLLFAAGFVAACSSAPPSAELTGRGLVSADEVPPAGAMTFGVPQWRRGDRLVYRRGGLVQVAFRVISTADGQYVLEEEATGLRNTFSHDLAVVGQEMPGDASMTRTMEPFDAVLSWPLWEGKTWVCHFVRRGGGDIPILARYHCDALETIETTAGSFECLRIWRRTKPAVDADYFEKTDVAWYAPEVGFFVRKLEDGMLTELEEYHRN